MDHKTYLSYGLKINSFIPLTGLTTSDDEADVSIIRGNVRLDARYTDFDEDHLVYRPGLSVRATPEYFIIDWGRLGLCLIEGGKRAIFEVGDNIDETDLIPYITGPILGVLLHQRERLVLHASAVNIHDRAIVFLGHKGAGKSTLAAHLQAAGYSLISDDMVPISFSDDIAQTLPGYPQIRLFPDSVKSMGLDPGNLPQINSWINKRHFTPAGDFSLTPITLGGIFILSVGDEISLTELNPYTAFMEIANNTYTGAFLKETGSIETHFKVCQKLVRSVPVRSLVRPHDYDRSEEIVDLIARSVVTPAV